MNDNFFLVCTTNPCNDEYTRYKLSKEFTDRFHCINFETLSNNEMEYILKNKCKQKGVDKQIQKIVSAHLKYTGKEGPKCKNMYTLRELDKACILLKKIKDEDKIIDILYRTRAGENLHTYSDGNNPFKFKEFISTSSRNKYGKIALECLKYGFNIILESEYSAGISYLAKSIAKTFNSKSSPFIITMTNELHVSDLTEFSIPITDKVDGKTEMKILIKKGIIYRAMEEGRVVIINDLERGNTKVIESINDIYECNTLDKSTFNFQRPISIHPNFRIIFTLHSNAQNKLSSAFFNRFIHIKIKDTNEITGHYKLEKGAPINTKIKDIIILTESKDLNDLCKEKKIACTSQIKAAYSYTKTSLEYNIPFCISGESGYGRSLGINLMLSQKFKDSKSKIHVVHCTSETTLESLIGKYSFEGQLLFKLGPLLQAAINGEIILLKNIDKLSFHAFSCIKAILDYVKNESDELIIPGFDLSEYKISKKFYCLATIDSNSMKDIPRHIFLHFQVKFLPEATEDDYLQICNLDQDLMGTRPKFMKALISCFLVSMKSKDTYDTSFRMLNRMISSIRLLCTGSDPLENALNLFALFQNTNEINNFSLITDLCNEFGYNIITNSILEQLKSKAYFNDNMLFKGSLSYDLRSFKDPEKILKISEEQLNALFNIKSCKSPIILVGPTSYKETIIKILNLNDLSVFNATDDSTIGDIIGCTTFKKNNNSSGKFGLGEIFDILFDYMSMEITTSIKIKEVNFDSTNLLQKTKEIIDEMNNQSMKPYFKYLIHIVEQKSEYATFFDIGYIIRELLLGNSILLKNVDQLNQGVIDSLIPFLNDPIDLKEYIPDITFHPQGSLYFTFSEQGYNKLSSSFRSRVQTVKIGKLGKEDLKNYVKDNALLDAYDQIINDYTDLLRAINVIKIASVLDNYKKVEDRITVANYLLQLKYDESIQNKNLLVFFDKEKTYKLEELLEYDQKTNILKSRRTGAKINVINFIDRHLKKIVFVPCVANLLDLCIISLATHIPLIVESSPGQTKSTLIRKFGEAIGKEIKSTNMSKNRSSEEFVGQLIPNDKGFSYEIGDLYKYIDQDVIYLIDEINLANSSLLSQFLAIFKAKYQSTIQHPHEKKKFVKISNIFATMNPSTLTAGRSYLPQGILSSSIVYKMPNYSDWENATIISSILNKYESVLEDFDESIKFIIECHKECLKHSNDVTIRDLLKLAEAFDFYSNNRLINKTIFSEESISKDDIIPNEESIPTDESNLSIEIMSNEYIESNKIPKDTIASYVQLVYSSKIIDNHSEFEKKVENYRGISHNVHISRKITKPEYLLIKQMRHALKMNRGIIIRGPSGCGKTYCINRLAKRDFDGKVHRLRTIQLCAQSDISELFGRFEPDFPNVIELVKKLKTCIKETLNDPTQNLPQSTKKKLNDYLGLLLDDKNKSKTIEDMKSDCEIMKYQHISYHIKEFFDKTRKDIKFEYRNSPLIKAMEKGYWIVLKNINLCPGDILESLNSLLEESYCLRITKGTQDVLYTMDDSLQGNNVITINKNFRLIMTSDDRILDSSHILPAPFLSRCIVVRIDHPSNRELSKIASNYYEAPIYADFLPCCFNNMPGNHVRDIIRMAKVYKNLANCSISQDERLAKTIKYILENDYSIPKSFFVPEKGKDDDIKEIISIIQTNLFDNTLDDEHFQPLNDEHIIKAFSELNESWISYDFQDLFKMTLKLSCFVLSGKKNNNIVNNNSIQDKIITYLTCGYLISCNKNRIIPDFIWKLKFKPAIWDLLFIDRNKYADFTTRDGFIDYINSNDSENVEFVKEFYDYSKKNINVIKYNKDECIRIVDSIFTRNSMKNKDHYFDQKDKKNIVLDTLYIPFPSIPNSSILHDELTYFQLIQLLDYFQIKPPFNKIMKSFNFDASKYKLISDYHEVFYNTIDLKIASILDKLLEFDFNYKCLKEVSLINNNEISGLLNAINSFCDKFKVTLEDLNDFGKEMKDYCNYNETELTYPIIKIIDSANKILEDILIQKRHEDLLNQEEKEIHPKIMNCKNSISNDFIKKNIERIFKKTLCYTNKVWEEVQSQLLFDKRISKDKSTNYIKYKCKFLEENYNYSQNSKEDEILKFSVIVTCFIVPPSCQNFSISSEVYDQLKFLIEEEKIQEILDKINRYGYTNNTTDYTHLGVFYIKIKDKIKDFDISISDLNSKERISKLISFMDKFRIGTCLVSDIKTTKPYILQMIDLDKPKKVKKSIEHLSKEKISEIISQYSKLYKKYDYQYDDDDETNTITKDQLKKECPAIPQEDFGDPDSLPWSQPYQDEPIKLIAHYLTEKEVFKSNIEFVEFDSITINDKKYKIIHVEELLYNLIYIIFREAADKSVAKNCQIIGDIFNVQNPATPQQILRKDMIIYLSQINDQDLNQNEKDLIKDAYNYLYNADQVRIDNDHLHIIYDKDFREKIIDFNNKYEQFQKFKKEINNYSREEEIGKIIHSCNDILSEISNCFNEIKSTFKCLLKSENKKDQSSRMNNKDFETSILYLSKICLNQYKEDYKSDDKYIHILPGGNKIYKSIKKPGKKEKEKLIQIKDKLFTKKSLKYDKKKVHTIKYPTFEICFNQYKYYTKIELEINQIKSNINDIKNISYLFVILNDINDCKNEKIKNIGSSILNSIATIQKKEQEIQKFNIHDEPIKPKVEYNITDGSFDKICDILLIGFNEGKPQLLNDIHYDLGDCYVNSTLRLHISNLTNATIKTNPPTKVTQNKDSVIISMNIVKNNHEIELINKNDDSNIGLLKFNCKLVDPELYLMFSFPCLIEKNVININGTIYKHFSITILSNSLKMSHFLKLETLNGSELTENEVSIYNRNKKISFRLKNPGRFKAYMQINFPLLNINIPVNIDINASIEDHTLMYDAVTLKELSPNEDVYNWSYIIIKSPKEPEFNGCELYPNIAEIPYLHLAYVHLPSNILSLNSKVKFTVYDTYYKITLEKKLRPKLKEFIYNDYPKFRYFIYSGNNVRLISHDSNSMDIKLNFFDGKLENIYFRICIYNQSKRFNDYGLIISNIDTEEVDLLINQINESQDIKLDKSRITIIPWICILKLFDDIPKKEEINKISRNVNPQLIIKEKQTYYAKIDRKSTNSCKCIPEFVFKKQIKQNNIRTVKVNINDYEMIESINHFDLIDMLAHFREIKSGLQLYRPIYQLKNQNNASNLSITSKLSQIYRALSFLNKDGIISDTLSEIVTIGKIIFEGKKIHSKNIEIYHDSKRTESFEDIRFKYYKIKEDLSEKGLDPSDPTISNGRSNDANKNILPFFHKFNIQSKDSFTFNKKTFNTVYKILIDEEKDIKEKNEIKSVDHNDNNDEKEFESANNIAAVPMTIKKSKFDESKAPLNAYRRSQSTNSKLYELSNIEIENKNLFISDNNLIEGAIPNLNAYVYNILETLMKADFSLSIPKNHITLLFDISILSGKNNKNKLTLNMMAILQILEALGIQFSVWMFADRNLCFCVKKPSDALDKARQTLILEAYNLDRINPDSYVLSALFTVGNQEIENNSSLFIIFSTFVSSQVLTPYMNWRDIALDCLKNRSLIGFIEPCQFIDEKISERLKKSLNKNDFISFVKFKTIHLSIFKLLSKIFDKCKNNEINHDFISKDTLEIQFHKFTDNIIYDQEIYICKNAINIQKSKRDYNEPSELKTTKIKGKFEIINPEKMNLGDLNFGNNIFYPNKATKYERTSHGYIIDIQGPINSYFSNFSNMNIFKEKTGEKNKRVCCRHNS